METRSDRVRQRKARSTGRSKSADGLFNCLTVIALIGIIIVAGGTALIYYDPLSLINPFPPPTIAPTLVMPAIASTRTAVPTAVVLSDTPVPEATATITPTLTESPVPSETPTIGPSPTKTVYSAYPFMMDTTSLISGDTFHPGEGCRLWVAGQVFDIKRAPLQGVFVNLGGYLSQILDQLSLTGTAIQYGQAGYEFTVAEKAVDSQEKLWVQLLNQSRVPISERVYFDTSSDCSKNLILINFRQVK